MGKYTITNKGKGARGAGFILLEPGETRSGVDLTDSQVLHLRAFGLLTVESEGKTTKTSTDKG